MLYPEDHPYHAPVIGSLAHIQNTTLDDLTSFTKKFYHPGNAHIAIAGPIDVEQVEALVRCCFGSIPSSTTSHKGHDFKLLGGRREQMTDAVAYPKGYLAWHSPEALAAGDATYDVLAYLLTHSGRGRLQRTLNAHNHLVEDVRVMQVSRQHGGLFRIDTILTSDGINCDLGVEVSQAIHQVLTTVDQDDLEQAKGQLQLQELLPLARSGGFGGLVDALNFFGCLTGDPTTLFEASDRYQQVSLDDVLRVAATLTPSSVTSLMVTKGPKAKNRTVGIAAAAAKKAPVTASEQPALPHYRPEKTSIVEDFGSSKILHVHKPRQPLQSNRLCFSLSQVAELRHKPYLARYIEQIVGHRFATDLVPFGKIAAQGRDFEVRIQAHIADLALLCPTGRAKDLASAVKQIISQVELSEQCFEQLNQDFAGRIGRMRGNQDFLLEQTAKQILLGSDHEACRLRFPTPQDMKVVTREEIVDGWRQLLQQPNLAIGAGPDSSTEVQDYFAELGLAGKNWVNSPYQRSPFQPLAPLTLITAAAEAGPQIDLSLVIKTVGLASGLAGQAAMVILEDALGGGFNSRLAQALRRLGPVSYGVRSNYIPYQDTGLLILSCSVATEHAKEACQILLEEIQQLASGATQFSADEVSQAARHYLVRSFPSFETAQNHSAKLRQLVSLGLPTDH